MSAALDAYVAEAERLAVGRQKDPAWLAAARRHALERFQALGFPTTRDEDWRFTSVTPVAEGRFAVAVNGASSLTRADVGRFSLAGGDAATLVFVNGRYAPKLSVTAALPPGVVIDSLGRLVTGPGATIETGLGRLAGVDARAFTALNTAFLADGAFIHVPPSTVVELPIHLLFVSVPEARSTMSHPRVLIDVGAGGQASIVESYVSIGDAAYFTNSVTEVAAGENATVHHYTIEREAPSSYHIGSLYVRTARDATTTCYSISLGGALVRNDVIAVLDGEGGTCTLNGLYFSDGTRLVDNHTTVDHAQPHCASREVYKGILTDRSRAVFNGKIIVRPDAQKTDAKQTNKALLLSEDAQINTKPQLEIFANDVKCTHGAAIGQMDEDAIFYLRARGVGEEDARSMLIQAFAADVLDQMPLAAVRARVNEELELRLPGWRS